PAPSETVEPKATAKEEARTTARATEEANAIAAARVKTMGQRPRTRWGSAGIRKLFYGFRSLRHVSMKRSRHAAVARPTPVSLRTVPHHSLRTSPKAIRRWTFVIRIFT